MGQMGAWVFRTHHVLCQVLRDLERQQRHSGVEGLIATRAPAHGGELFLGAVGAFAMDSYAARAWGGQPIAARKSRFSADPRLREPHERSCSRGFLTR